MNTKKVIAREGLIIMGFIIVIMLLMFIPKVSLFIDNLIQKYVKHSDIVWLENPPLEQAINDLIPIVILCYPLYLGFRFIIWAIKTLKGEKNMIIKKVVAREGLIILVCVICAGIFLFLQSLIPYSSPEYAYNVETGGHKYVVSTQEAIYSFEFKDKAELYKVLQDKYPKDLGKNDGVDFVPDDLKISSPKTIYNFAGHIRNLLGNLGLLSIFVVYPLYLIILFVMWAVKTLKGKE